MSPAPTATPSSRSPRRRRAGRNDRRPARGAAPVRQRTERAWPSRPTGDRSTSPTARTTQWPWSSSARRPRHTPVATAPAGPPGSSPSAGIPAPIAVRTAAALPCSGRLEPGATDRRQYQGTRVASPKVRASAGFNSHDHLGSISIVLAPDADRLAAYTRQVAENNRQALALAGLEPPDRDAAPRGLCPAHGEPSPIKHVIYIIKENRTYDQVFGDIKEGNGDPSLVMFGREVTPNQHALAREFVLLDNYLLLGRALGRWPCLGDRGLCHRLPRTPLRRFHPQLSLRWRRPAGLRIERASSGTTPWRTARPSATTESSSRPRSRRRTATMERPLRRLSGRHLAGEGRGPAHRRNPPRPLLPHVSSGFRAPYPTSTAPASSSRSSASSRRRDRCPT